MRNKLLKLLRKIEGNVFENNYSDCLGEPMFDYEVTEILHHPNYRTITNQYNTSCPLPKYKGHQPIILDSSLRPELKRMELDGLIYIGTQKGSKMATNNMSIVPDHDETTFITESITLPDSSIATSDGDYQNIILSKNNTDETAKIIDDFSGVINTHLMKLFNKRSINSYEISFVQLLIWKDIYSNSSWGKDVLPEKETVKSWIEEYDDYFPKK